MSQPWVRREEKETIVAPWGEARGIIAKDFIRHRMTPTTKHYLAPHVNSVWL